MTMVDNDIRFEPATNADDAIVPEGRWTLELLRIERAEPSSFKPEDGPRFKWIFALYDGPGMALGERFYFNGDPYEFFRHTSRKNSPRAFARQYTEALLGRRLEDGEIPALSALIGRRMSGVVIYEDGISDPTQKVLKLGSLKACAPPVSTQAPTRPSAAQVTANATDEDVDRALLISDVEKMIGRLRKIAPEQAKGWDIDLAALSTEKLNDGKSAISAEIEAALDA